MTKVVGSQWETIDGENGPLGFPPLPACYVIYLDGVLSYIGQTTNLRKRIAGHKIDICRYSNHVSSVWGQYRSIRVKVNFGTRYGDWAMRELRLIHRLQPRLNCVGSVKQRGAA